MTRALPSLLLFLLVSGGCIEIEDLRPPEPELPPSGQVDTGWVPDTITTELPPAEPCEVDDDCVSWLGSAACLLPRCVDSVCAADPVEDGTPCSDGDFSTHGDQCTGGACEPGPAVCVCQVDGDCDAFDDGNACNGRLMCDGCACLPMDTPPGTPCDDLNPATIEDVCVDDVVCEGHIPCQCETAADCGDHQCNAYACAECQCLAFPAAAGQLYASEGFIGGLPSTWGVDSDSAEVTWRPDATGGVRATGPDGIYDHGAVTTVLTSPPVVLPAGHVVLRVDAALFSAEESCDDRLTLRVDDEVLHTLCGPTGAETYTWSIPSDTVSTFSAVFESDDDDNAAAGAWIGDVRWIRTQQTDVACVKEPALGVETVVPLDPAGPQRRPAVGALPQGGVRVYWEADDGVHAVTYDAELQTQDTETLLDPDGRAPAAAGPFATWVRDDGFVVQTDDGQAVLPAAFPIESPAITADGAALAWRLITEDGPAAHAHLAPHDGAAILDVYPPTEGLLGPAVATDGAGAVRFVVSDPDFGVLTVQLDADPEPLSDLPATSPPTLGFGANRFVTVWTEKDLIRIHNGDEILEVIAPGARDPAIAATATNWWLLWTEEGATDTGIEGAVLTGTANAVTPIIKLIATYVFDDQDQPALAPFGPEETIGAWRSAWIDGDASGVVLRRLQTGVAGL